MEGKTFSPGPALQRVEKYVDFFGFSDEGSVANVKINEMLETIERLYDKESLPNITQIMLYSNSCGACQRSIPIWEKLTRALSMRLRNYTHMAIEINEAKEMGGYRVTGGFIYQKYKAKGTPVFLQDFKINVIVKKHSNREEIREIVKNDDFYVLAEGQLQPFMFLAKAFDIPNAYTESKMTNPGAPVFTERKWDIGRWKPVTSQ